MNNLVARAAAFSGFIAVAENEGRIAAVNRCATQKQEQNRVFPQSVKPALLFSRLRARLKPRPFRTTQNAIQVSWMAFFPSILEAVRLLRSDSHPVERPVHEEDLDREEC